MTWNPITTTGLAAWVEQSCAAMSITECSQFEALRIPPRPLPCLRDPLTGTEMLYALARLDRRYLVFDDVENEFGIAIHDDGENEILRFWLLAGELRQALQVLLSGDYGDCVPAPGGGNV
jgi:hypothetical protein